MMRIYAYITPTVPNRPQLPYKSHRTYLTNRMGSISHHITPLVINSLGGGHTHTHASTHACRHSQTEAVLRNQACAVLWPARDGIHIYCWFNGFKMLPKNLFFRQFLTMAVQEPCSITKNT